MWIFQAIATHAEAAAIGAAAVTISFALRGDCLHLDRWQRHGLHAGDTEWAQLVATDHHAADAVGDAGSGHVPFLLLMLGVVGVLLFAFPQLITSTTGA